MYNPLLYPNSELIKTSLAKSVAIVGSLLFLAASNDKVKVNTK